MNFLAHLHIAQHCNSNLAGNLLGDFVKGDPNKHYSDSLSDGIRLHRFVDSYTAVMMCLVQQNLSFQTKQSALRLLLSMYSGITA